MTWGFVPVREDFRESVLAEFTVVERDLAAKLGALSERLKEQPPLVLRHLRAQLLLSEGLPFAAYQEAADLASGTAAAIRQQALRALGLERTTLR